jgi:hypothetical protein
LTVSPSGSTLIEKAKEAKEVRNVRALRSDPLGGDTESASSGRPDRIVIEQVEVCVCPDCGHVEPYEVGVLCINLTCVNCGIELQRG